jgi:hypothetical protein
METHVNRITTELATSLALWRSDDPRDPDDLACALSDVEAVLRGLKSVGIDLRQRGQLEALIDEAQEATP